jgi:hypothetical protein
MVYIIEPGTEDALDTYAPAELARLLRTPGLKDDARRAVETVAVL